MGKCEDSIIASQAHDRASYLCRPLQDSQECQCPSQSCQPGKVVVEGGGTDSQVRGKCDDAHGIETISVRQLSGSQCNRLIIQPCSCCHYFLSLLNATCRSTTAKKARML